MRDLTTEEIMAVVPDVIDATQIELNPRSHVKPWQRRRGSARRKWWTANDRIKAATTYALVGSSTETERLTGISQNTIRSWKTQDWWPKIIERIRLEADDELDVKFSRVVNKALTVVMDRMEHGDFVYDQSRGQMIRKPLGARDSAQVASSFIDKRQLLRQKREINREETGVTERLKKLADEFERFTKSKTIEGEKLTDEAIVAASATVSLHDIPVQRVERTPTVRKNLPVNEIWKYAEQGVGKVAENV